MAIEHPQLLLVEDEPLVAIDLQRRLESMGFRVAGHAATGEEAIAKSRALEPDLILMDIGLIGSLDGIEAARMIHRRMDVPVVFMTADCDESTLRRVRDIGPHGFVLKPIRDLEMRSSIEMILYRCQLRRQ